MNAEEIIQKCNHIPSSVFEPEQRMWFEMLSKLKGKPVIVDFGTGHGKSASSLGLSCPQGVVYTFDPGIPYINGGCNEEQYEEETRKFIADSGATNVIFTRESSLEKKWRKKIDVLNIDSDHTYEGTKAEIEKWVDFVKVGGLLFFHDYEHPRCPGVRQAIDEVLPDNFELVTITDAGAVKCACYRRIS